MNFTREPIIETILTPKDGYKLLISNTKGEKKEEFSVDAVEVVSFGHSFFYRSLERPKSFLVPVSDYQVVEVKETRVSLKAASPDKSIKIGGGRSQAVKASSSDKDKEEEPKKKGRRQRRRRAATEAKKEEVKEKVSSEETPSEPISEEPKVARLIPPPSTLISDSISRYREEQTQAEVSEEEVPKKKNSRIRKKKAAAEQEIPEPPPIPVTVDTETE